MTSLEQLLQAKDSLYRIVLTCKSLQPTQVQDLHQSHIEHWHKHIIDRQDLNAGSCFLPLESFPRIIRDTSAHAGQPISADTNMPSSSRAGRRRHDWPAADGIVFLKTNIPRS
jgi:hypothetical protein